MADTTETPVGEAPALQFAGVQGETLIRKSGEIEGQGFVIENLQDCEVYLLDHSGQVQIDDCTGCKIVVGPCSGAVFVRDCANCELQVASQQLRTRDCKDLKLGVYCSTQPSLETSTEITISCWRVAYPGLTDHFTKAGLDPVANQWSSVFDFTNESTDGSPNFSIEASFLGWWEVPVDGNTAYENPVPASTGDVYSQGFAAFGDGEARAEAPEDAFTMQGDNQSGLPTQKSMGENSPLMIWFRQNQKELEVKEKEEAKVKAESQKKAQAWLEKFYQERKKGIDKRSKLNLSDNQVRTKQPVVQGSTPWEKVTSVIDFGFQGQTKDVTRYKQVLIMAKTKKLAIRA